MSAPVDCMRAAADLRERTDPHLVAVSPVALNGNNAVFALALRSALSAVYAANDAGASVLSISIEGGHPRVRIEPPKHPDTLGAAMYRRETRNGVTHIGWVALRHGALLQWDTTREVPR